MARTAAIAASTGQEAIDGQGWTTGDTTARIDPLANLAEVIKCVRNLQDAWNEGHNLSATMQALAEAADTYDPMIDEGGE